MFQHAFIHMTSIIQSYSIDRACIMFRMSVSHRVFIHSVILYTINWRDWMNPCEIHNSHIMQAFVSTIHYSHSLLTTKWKVQADYQAVLSFSHSLFSFSFCHPRCWEWSTCQVRDNVSPFPRASPTGAPYPKSERSTGKGETCGSQRMCNFNAVLSSHSLKAEDIYNLTMVILNTKCCCIRQMEIKDIQL